MVLSPARSSSSSSSSSSLHHASLVDPSLHSPAVLQLVDTKLSQPVIKYVVDRVAETVDFAMGRSSGSKSPHRDLNAFTTFVTNVIARAELTTPVILASLVYIDRARPHLHIALEEWALERVFLGAVICASKYLNDSTLKNVHWALCTGVFGKRDIGRIEREFLDVLDFELGVTEDDILSHHDGLSAIASPPSSYVPRHSHVAYRARGATAQRDLLAVTVPSLDPSSPSSSLSGSSLGTPDSLASSPSPSVIINTSPAPQPMATSPDAVVNSKPKSKFHLATSTLELLRSFPAPHHRQHHHRPVSKNDASSLQNFPPRLTVPSVGA